MSSPGIAAIPSSSRTMSLIFNMLSLSVNFMESMRASTAALNSTLASVSQERFSISKSTSVAERSMSSTVREPLMFPDRLKSSSPTEAAIFDSRSV